MVLLFCEKFRFSFYLRRRKWMNMMNEEKDEDGCGDDDVEGQDDSGDDDEHMMKLL